MCGWDHSHCSRCQSECVGNNSKYIDGEGIVCNECLKNKKEAGMGKYALAIGPEQKAQINSLMEYADKHALSYGEMLEASKGRRLPVGDDPNFVINLPVDFRVVFSYEHQKFGRARHMSVSHPSGLPPVPVVNALLEEFKFRGRVMESDLFHLLVWQENENAINVLEMESM